MDVFVILMAIGLIGMLLMAVPGLGRHGHTWPGSHGSTHLPALPNHGAVHGASSAVQPHAQPLQPAANRGEGLAASLPQATHLATNAQGAAHASFPWRAISPRALLSMMALYGASGYAFVESMHLTTGTAGLLALVPAVLIERFAVTPLWNLLFRFEGKPSDSLQSLTMTRAQAVTDFHNGRGMVSVVHDNRIVQLRADLSDQFREARVQVGDTLMIEEVDEANELLTVSPG